MVKKEWLVMEITCPGDVYCKWKVVKVNHSDEVKGCVRERERERERYVINSLDLIMIMHKLALR
jgi:hypothetical protein